MSIAIVGPRASPEMLHDFSQTLVDDLASQGIRANIAPPASAADTNVTIVKWDPGSRGLRWLASFGAGKGEIVVEVESLGVHGTAEGWVTGGWFGGDSENAADAAAELIGHTLANGRPPQAPASSSPHAIAAGH